MNGKEAEGRNDPDKSGKILRNEEEGKRRVRKQ